MRFALFAALLVSPVSLCAQQIATPGTVFVSDMVSGQLSEMDFRKQEWRERILPAGEGELAVRSCDEGSCRVELRRNVLEYVAIAYDADAVESVGDLEALIEDGGPNVSVIEVSEREGGAFFPLEDGKTARWTEDWRFGEDGMTYHMSWTQSCCVTADIPAAISDKFWEIRYDWELVPGEDDATQSGESRMLFDPALGYYVRQIHHTISEGTAPYTTRTDLTAVIPPEG